MDFTKVFNLSDFITFDESLKYSLNSGMDPYFDYFIHQIFNHPFFSFDYGYKIILKIKIGRDHYYTIFKGQRTLFVANSEDTSKLKDLYFEIVMKIIELLNEYYIIEILQRDNSLPEAFIMELFDIGNTIKAKTRDGKIPNIQTFKDIGSINQFILFNRDFNLFGGHPYNKVLRHDFFNNIFKGKTIQPLI